MPRTMPAVRRTLALLERHGVQPVTLLVVPGSGWSVREIDELKSLERAGYLIAGHGWQHHVEQIRGLRHRVHSLFLSRKVAEHLALDADGILNLLRRCRDWFPQHGLSVPELYVPPAWALGAVSRTALRDAALFRGLEVFSGVLDTASGDLRKSPVLGYEADEALRIPVLRAWNALSRWRASSTGVVRIGIHPSDIDHPLCPDLIEDLKRFPRYTSYTAVINAVDDSNASPAPPDAAGRLDSR